jgi:hypothetical protein
VYKYDNPAATSLLDLNPKRLTGQIKGKLMKIQKNSRVYTSVIIPDYSKQCVLEIERKELSDCYKIVRGNPPFFKCLVGKEYYNESSYGHRMKQIDYEIDQQIMNPYVGTKTAFMSLESLDSISKLKAELEYTQFI